VNNNTQRVCAFLFKFSVVSAPSVSGLGHLNISPYSAPSPSILNAQAQGWPQPVQSGQAEAARAQFELAVSSLVVRVSIDAPLEPKE